MLRPVRIVWSGRAYTFPDLLPEERHAPAGVTEATRKNLAHLSDMVTWLEPLLEEKVSCFAALEGGNAVAVCHSARSPPDAAEAGVETAEAFRERGYDRCPVAAWFHAVRQQTRSPLYSTSWSNAVSLRRARQLALQLYTSDYHLS